MKLAVQFPKNTCPENGIAYFLTSSFIVYFYNKYTAVILSVPHFHSSEAPCLQLVEQMATQPSNQINRQ
uniref:Uncharacterized protein n=1 Tax=Arion vulgaris TaxID=1028688 RepID=A0A0B7BUL0_9EUPU